MQPPPLLFSANQPICIHPLGQCTLLPTDTPLHHHHDQILVVQQCVTPLAHASVQTRVNYEDVLWKKCRVPLPCTSPLQVDWVHARRGELVLPLSVVWWIAPGVEDTVLCHCCQNKPTLTGCDNLGAVKVLVVDTWLSAGSW